MQPEIQTIIEKRLADALPALYRRQCPNGQASLLGFFHLLDQSSNVAVRLRIDRSGEMTLTLDAALAEAQMSSESRLQAPDDTTNEPRCEML